MMHKKLIPFHDVPQLSKTDLAYVSGDRALMPFYKYELRHEVFQQIIRDKSTEALPRQTLKEVLTRQYQDLPNNAQSLKIIDLLAQPNTFTVTTAHQPSLFLGPLYFVYKAITTINLAEAIQGIVGMNYRIVPIFVLGSEDHDIEELNHANLFNKTVRWEPELGGPVGALPAATLKEALERLDEILGHTDHARQMFARIERAYTQQTTFAAATQALLHDIFGKYGMIAFDMNDAALKRHFAPVIKNELIDHSAQRLVKATTEQLNALGFKTQAAPRDINLFYLSPYSRERIEKAGDRYKVLNTDLSFSEEEILAEVDQHPERFSPNVVLRPLYQEMTLPNLAYVGGGGELAYWLERKALFEHYKVNFPVLVRRNSVLWVDRDGLKRLQRLGFTPTQMFADTEALIRRFVENKASVEVNLRAEMSEMNQIFDRLCQKAMAVDPTLEGAVQADKVKYNAALEQWESRLIRAEKQKHEIAISQIRSIKEKYFPGGGLQERHENFLPLYLRYGQRFFDTLKEKMLPLEQGFVLLEDKS